MSEKKRMVCGFLMTFDMDKFLLVDKVIVKDIDKMGPGMLMNLRWCGIGGEIKSDIQLQTIEIGDTGREENREIEVEEHPTAAMAREFKEETGCEVKAFRWHCFMIKEYQHAKIYMYVAFCSPDEMLKIRNHFPDQMGPEGQLQIHDVVGILFDPEQYTFDMPYLMSMMIRETRRGFITKLDPEGVNSSAKSPKTSSSS